MKTLIESYIFNPTLKQIQLVSTTQLKLEQILLITNTTNNTIIYNFANPQQGGTLNNNMLTLIYNTTLMSSGDSLQIFVETYVMPATEETANLLLTLSEDIETSVIFLKRIAKLVEPISVQDTQQRQRIIVDNIIAGTITTVSTVSSVTNISTISGVDYRWQVIDQARNTYSNSIRRNLS